MPLSPADQEFYESKLELRSFGYVFGATTIIGTIAAPLLNFMQDWSAGLTARWDLVIVRDWAILGFMLGALVAFLMYLAFKFLLQVGWLPARS